MWFDTDTGDNPHKGRDLLNETVKAFLAKGCVVIGRHEDGTRRTYCYKLRNPAKEKFFLIAKASGLYKDMVSTQLELPQRAVKDKAPILLVWKNYAESKTPEAVFLLFNPQSILDDNLGTNERFDVQFVNWKITHGLPWNQKASITELYRKSREKQTTIGGFT